MEERKKIEAEFHNRIRDREMFEDKEKYRHLMSNRRFYCVNRNNERFRRKFIMKKCQGKTVLDYCCGEGVLAIFMAQHDAKKAVGIDISPDSIKISKKSAQEKGVADITEFLVMDAENLKFRENTFDLIVCSGVLHHLDIKKAYPEIARVLKPDGLVYCAEPLIHNPVFQLYRRRTAHLRTEWETDHILSKKDIMLTEDYFEKIETRFSNLFTLVAVPFRKTFIFNPLFSALKTIDSVIFNLTPLRWWAWQIDFILSNPKKTPKNK